MSEESQTRENCRKQAQDEQIRLLLEDQAFDKHFLITTVSQYIEKNLQEQGECSP